DPMVVNEGLDASEGVEHDIFCVRKIIRMHALDESLVGAVELVFLYSVNPIKLIGPGDDVGLDVPLEAPYVGDALCLLDPTSAGRELYLEKPPLGHVDGGPHAPQYLALLIFEGLDQHFEPPLSNLVSEGLRLSRERGQVVCDCRLGRIACANEFLDRHSYGLARVDPRHRAHAS